MLDLPSSGLVFVAVVVGKDTKYLHKAHEADQEICCGQSI